MENRATSTGQNENVHRLNSTIIPSAAAGLAMRVNNNLDSCSEQQSIRHQTFLHAFSSLSTLSDNRSNRDNNEVSNNQEYQLSENQGYSSQSSSYQQLLVQHTVELHTAASDRDIGESHQSANGAYLQPLESTCLTPSQSYLSPVR
jgi:hypothetical protein